MVTVALEMHIMSKKHACRQPALLPAAPALCPPPATMGCTPRGAPSVCSSAKGTGGDGVRGAPESVTHTQVPPGPLLRTVTFVLCVLFM